MGINIIKKTYTESVLDVPQDQLNPLIWKDEKIIPEVRKTILDAIEKFDLKNIKRISFVGSNTSYQYTPVSDVDIHIWIPDASPEDLKKYKGSLPRDMKLPGTEMPLQFYIVTVDESQGYKGKGAMYDLEKEKWIIPPEKKDLKVPYSYLMSMAKFFIEGIENRIREYETDIKEKEHLEKYLQTSKDEEEKKDITERLELKKQEIESDIDALIIASEILWGYRSDAYTGKAFDTELQMGEGNESTQNAVYKIIEELGTKKRMADIIKTREAKND